MATRGWLETSEVQAEVLAKELAAYGAETFIFTDISRDGMMQGPNVEAIVSLAKASGRTVIASGGVSVMDDLLRLSRHADDGVGGAIVGKALYTEASICLKQYVRSISKGYSDREEEVACWQKESSPVWT